jgi:hypothetical protein
MTGAKPETGNVLRNFWTKGRLSGDALLPQSPIALGNKNSHKWDEVGCGVLLSAMNLCFTVFAGFGSVIPVPADVSVKKDPNRKF